MQKILKRGQIYWAELGQNEGSVQSGRRPVCIYANKPSLTYSSIATVIPCTSRVDKLKAIPTHVLLESVMGRPCVLLPEQIQTISKEQLIGDEPIYELTETEMRTLNRAVMKQLGIGF